MSSQVIKRSLTIDWLGGTIARLRWEKRESQKQKQVKGFLNSLHLSSHQSSFSRDLKTIGNVCFRCWVIISWRGWGFDESFFAPGCKSLLPPPSHPVQMNKERQRGWHFALLNHKHSRRRRQVIGRKKTKNRNRNVSDPAWVSVIWFHFHTPIKHLLGCVICHSMVHWLGHTVSCFTSLQNH